MVSKIWNNCPDVAQVLKIVYEVQTVLHNHIIHILKIADQVVDIATHRGKGVAWTFMEAFSSFALLLASCHNDGFKRGKTNINAGESKTYCKCKIAGCPKVLRAVTFFCGIPKKMLSTDNSSRQNMTQVLFMNTVLWSYRYEVTLLFFMKKVRSYWKIIDTIVVIYRIIKSTKKINWSM